MGVDKFDRLLVYRARKRPLDPNLGDALVVEADHEQAGFQNSATATVAFVIAVPKARGISGMESLKMRMHPAGLSAQPRAQPVGLFAEAGHDRCSQAHHRDHALQSQRGDPQGAAHTAQDHIR